MRSLATFGKSSFKLALCIVLAIATLGSFCSLFAYMSGGRSDRMAIETAVMLKLHAWQLKSDAQIYAWIEHEHAIAEPAALSALADYAQSHPRWFNQFLIGIRQRQKRTELLRVIQASLRESARAKASAI